MRYRSLLATACLCIAAATASAEPDTATLSARLATTLDEFRMRYGFPGATVAITLADGRLATAATGLADIEAERRMTPATRMLAASIGKTFVGATVLALESEGRLSQDDLLADYLGDRPWFPDLPNGEKITIGHLVHHQSGLADHPQLPAFQAAFAARLAAGGKAFTPGEVLAFVLDREPLFEPGKGFAYSDSGYVLLGLVIETISGRPYYALVRELFIEPLRLRDTVPSDRRDIPGLAVGYTVPDNPFGLPERTADAAGRLAWDPAVEWTGGGFASTSGDLTRWGHALFGGEALAAPYLDRLLDGVPVAAGSQHALYGAGVAIYPHTPRGPVYGHGGWIPGYVSSLRHYARHGVTIAFQVNTDAGVVDDSSDLVPALEAALADLAIGAGT